MHYWFFPWIGVLGIVWWFRKCVLIILDELVETTKAIDNQHADLKERVELAVDGHEVTHTMIIETAAALMMETTAALTREPQPWYSPCGYHCPRGRKS